MTTPPPGSVDDLLEVSKALAWARNPKTTGYSESYLNGYEKAYEEVQNSLTALTAHYLSLALSAIPEKKDYMTRRHETKWGPQECGVWNEALDQTTANIQAVFTSGDK